MFLKGVRTYILDGERVVLCPSVMEWARWNEGAANTRVDYTEITSDCRVSTVFLGLDHRFFGDGPPLVFETMIFGGPKDLDENLWRYSSWDDAAIGHKAAVRKAREAIGQKVR
jgi:hypothetical protein